MHGLKMHLMFCYNEFWIYLHTFQSPEGGRLIEVGLYHDGDRHENVA